MRWRSTAGAFVLAAALAFTVVMSAALWPRLDAARAQPPGDALAALKARFARPSFIPHPASNPPTPAKIALGRRIFADPELSATGTIACATCHDPRLAFADGEPASKGVTGRPLKRHTPTLW
ncbi:MAG TPA: cytochrome-c peroxidase, partial [Hyphomicrobiaceae bacterium]|nr:cytochrome-c peroxidase [Hyphomicrobiaceae bacterium]